jgi:hypothetical protein
MKTSIQCRIAILISLVAGGGACAFGDEGVVNPARRQEVLDVSKGLLAPKNLPAVGKDPFHSEAYAESIAGGTRGTETPSPATGESTATTKVAAPAGPRSAHELLQAIATSPSLKPSGYFVLGGQPTLVFGQKRVKAGSFLTITFEGAEYTLEIVSIDRPNFTLRLNREEFTRPIK